MNAESKTERKALDFLFACPTTPPDYLVSVPTSSSEWLSSFETSSLPMSRGRKGEESVCHEHLRADVKIVNFLAEDEVWMLLCESCEDY